MATLYDRIGNTGMARCKKCSATDRVSNYEHQGCTTCNDKTTEKMYLVCIECGEAFDTLDAAAQHEDHFDEPAEFRIVPESEAF